MKVGIIGCGLIGQKRAKALGACELVACADVLLQKAEALAVNFPNCTAYQDWRQVIKRDDIQIILVATHHAMLAEMTLAAVMAGKHVLVEKPGGCSHLELKKIMQAANAHEVCVRVGFNHRYHPGMQYARQLIGEQQIGDLLFVRARYGHGGRSGYEKEWRANPALSGGGELIDQGVHLIDLARWFLGDFTQIQGSLHTYFWEMPVEDNAFMLLTTAKAQVAQLHASWTEWKNLFSFEIMGRVGKIEINGLGGSYGIEKVILHKMSASLGVPETVVTEYPQTDESWSIEFNEFLADIKQKREPAVSLHDAYQVLKIVESLYQQTSSIPQREVCL